FQIAPNSSNATTITSGGSLSSPGGLVVQANGDFLVADSAAIYQVFANPARNIISGNSGDGILITGTGTDNNTIAGNYIGIDAAGLSAPANQNGIVISDGASGTVIGGTRNVISGNTFDGILLDGDSNTVVQGNYIGTDVTGLAPLANSSIGISIQNAASG